MGLYRFLINFKEPPQPPRVINLHSGGHTQQTMSGRTYNGELGGPVIIDSKQSHYFTDQVADAIVVIHCVWTAEPLQRIDRLYFLVGFY